VVTRQVPEVGVGDPAPGPGWSVIDVGDRLRGGGFEGDLVSEGFEFADEPAFPCFRAIDAAGEVVGAQVAVGGVLGEHMPNNDDEGVGGGGGGFPPALFAEAAVEAAELGADVGGGAPGGPGAFGEGRAELGVALTGFAGAVFAGVVLFVDLGVACSAMSTAPLCGTCWCSRIPTARAPPGHTPAASSSRLLCR
jgi:hypothetical protein